MYARDAVVVQGVAAHVLDRLLARYLPGVLPGLPSWMRDEVLAVRDELRRASDAYTALPAADPGKAETVVAEAAAESTVESVSTGAAAAILGVSERRARQLAAAGLGRKVGGVWVLDRRAVLAELQHRNGGDRD